MVYCIPDNILQEDGTTSHFAYEIIHSLKEKFNEFI